MLKRYIISLILSATLLVASALPSHAEVYGPNVKTRNNTILVSTGMNLDEKSIEEINKGVSKDIVFYIDLFRQWRGWPDEFVLGVSVAQTLRCDPVKKEFIAVSKRGGNEVTKRFETCDQLISWTMSLPDEKIASVAGLDPEAKYYVVTTVESRIRRIPKFIKRVLFFIPDTEFRVEAESKVFVLGEVK
ncbi:MAG: DUF4390 domain-containing protein [Thermodesulfovibrionales bacterium]|nr:DUF4390 domain-containing protein [Thermodesulfovibrionales bacterium]